MRPTFKWNDSTQRDSRITEEMLKSTLNPIEDTEEIKYKERFENSLMRVCVLALENDRLNASLTRERVKNESLKNELEHSKLVFNKKLGESGNSDYEFRSKLALFERENVQLKELLEERDQEIIGWMKRFGDIENKYKIAKEAEKQLKIVRGDLAETRIRLDDTTSENVNLKQEINRLKEEFEN